MGRYVIRRLLQFIPTVLGTLFLLHYLTSVGMQLTGNPVRALFGDRTPSPATVEAITRKLGLDDPCLKSPGNPCLELFWQRLGLAPRNGTFSGYLQGDFGTNLRFREVTDIVSTALPYTLKITLIAFLVEAIIGIIAGVLAGKRSGGFMDYVVKIGTVLVISVPVFVLGLLVQLFVSVKFGNWLRTQEWVPEVISRGLFGAAYKIDYPFASLVIPGVVLGLLGLAATARLTRTSVQENLRADFVRTARAKGLTGKRVIGVHTLRNSLIPVVTNLGLSVAVYLTGAIITEGIFNVPGVGNQIGKAIFQGESMVLIGITTMLVLAYLTITLLVDLLYAVLDPRIRYE
ncbi:ABC transporter permease [Catellatospora sp. KI3]|uniref:ABC transporter permease n=1 Tax=Catellatospora sp. KI3 TaxID=3041620 RepID=UPI002482152E|nr:ABC transporter permease [Catellatospora sp. KI3]MDI1460341.1 ABC transporter permease [Catellatospora sp. KI3]